MLTEELAGKTREELLRLDKDFVLDLLGIDISATRMKCALLGLKIVKSAALGDAADWEDRRGRSDGGRSGHRARADLAPHDAADPRCGCGARSASRCVEHPGGLGEAPRDFFGVVSQTRTLSAADFDRMARAHVGMVRVALPWQEVDPTPAPGDYEWGRFDAIVAGAARHGITVLPTVYTVPHWVSLIEHCTTPANGPCSITPPHTTYGLSLWRTFLAEAVGRYGPDGSFWEGHPALRYEPITAWQIWNEENSPGFFQPRPDPARYADLLRAASEAIHGQDPTAQVVIGGLFGYPLNGRDGGLRATEYLRDLYAIPDIEAAFDGVAVHPYASRISGVEGQMGRINHIIHQAHDEQARIWVTEIGWGSGGGPEPLNRGRRGQAKRLRQAFAFFAASAWRCGSTPCSGTPGEDVSARDAICKWCARSGLFPTGLAQRPKPAFRAFTAFTGGN